MTAWATQADCRPVLILSSRKGQARAEFQRELILIARRLSRLVDMLNSDQRMGSTRFKIRDLKNARRTFVRRSIRIQYGLEIGKWMTSTTVHVIVEGMAFEDGLPDRTSLTLPPLADGSIHPPGEMSPYRLASLLHDLSLPMLVGTDALSQEEAERAGQAIVEGCAALVNPALDGAAHSFQLSSGLPFGPASLQCRVTGEWESAVDSPSSLEITKALPSMAVARIVIDQPDAASATTALSLARQRWEAHDFEPDPIKSVRLARLCPTTAEAMERWTPRDRLYDQTDFF